MMCGDPVVRTYDGAYLMVYDNTKTLMTQFDDLQRNTCKFRVRCVTASTYYLDSLTEPVWVDWCGIAFHQHKNDVKYFRNWVVGQSLTKIGERGLGYSGILAVDLSAGPRQFPYQGEDISTWNSKVPAPACNPDYEIFADGDVIKFRSYCCGWALDFYPRGRDTCVILYAEDGNEYIESFKQQLDGICGNLDGDKLNDWRRCLDGGSVQPNTVQSLQDIADSCKDGDHDGQAYIGGTKINSF